MPTINTFTDYTASQKDIERRRKMAELMQQQSMQPIEVGQGGGQPAPISWTQGLAKALQAYSGRKNLDTAQNDEKALVTRARTEAAEFFGGMPQAKTEDLQAQMPFQNDDEGNAMPSAMKTTQPTKQEMLAFAMKGVASGNPMVSPVASALMAQYMKPQEDFTLGEGQQRFRDGQVVASGGPRTFAPPQPKTPTPQAPGTLRTKINGENQVQEELQPDGSWKSVGTGPRFAKQVGGAGGAGQQKAPTGYRYKTDGDLEPIPGGPKDMSGRNKAVAETAALKAKIVMDKVDEALADVGGTSTGLVGSVMGVIPGTKAYNLEATLDTIKANVGFNELQAMRQASPTGGALGQVAVRELDMLQAVLASLKKGQSQDKLVQSLNQVKQHYGNWKKAVDAAAATEGGTPTPAPEAPPTKPRRYNPATGALE